MSVKVVRKDKQTTDNLIKKFNEKMKASNVIQDYIDKQYYTKKSTKKRMKKYASIKRHKIKQSSNE